MLLTETFSIAPSEKEPMEIIKRTIQTNTDISYGFVMNINSIRVKERYISYSGNIIYKTEADIETFLPKCGQIYEAVVEVNRSDAYIAKVMDCMSVIFHSDAEHKPGDRVKCILEKLRFQCGTYRGIASLISEED